jgi:hypothetical protein
MKNFDENACKDAFCALCEELVHGELISVDECQYWLFELGYRSKNASLAEFSELCDLADRSELINSIECQYWLFERGHLAARKLSVDTSEFEQLETAQFAHLSQKFA